MTQLGSLAATQEAKILTADSAPSPVRVTEGSRIARSRAMMYSILAQALSSPSVSMCSAVEEGVFTALLDYALAGMPASHRQAFDEPGFLDKFGADLDDRPFAEAILIEYTRLFASNLHCPQYEADYLARNSDSAVHFIARVVSMYSTFGVKPANDLGERPDHIAVELDFMNFLATKEAHAKERKQAGHARLCRRAQAKFFSDHLSLWGSAFARNLGEVTSLSFYHGIRDLLEAFLLAEAKYLKVESKAPSIEAEKSDASQDCGCNRCAGAASEQPKELISIAGLGREAVDRRD